MVSYSILQKVYRCDKNHVVHEESNGQGAEHQTSSDGQNELSDSHSPAHNPTQEKVLNAITETVVSDGITLTPLVPATPPVNYVQSGGNSSVEVKPLHFGSQHDHVTKNNYDSATNLIVSSDCDYRTNSTPPIRALKRKSACQLQITSHHTDTDDDGGGGKTRVKKQRKFEQKKLSYPYNKLSCEMIEIFTQRECPYCKQPIKGINTLIGHITDVHFMTKRFVCPCEKCDSSFEDALDFLNHCWQNHRMFQSYKCVFCSKDFNQPNEVVDHLSSHHLGCIICGVEFTTFSDLQHHFLSMHSANKETSSLICPICNINTEGVYSFTAHIRKHLKMKSFPCLLCSTFSGAREEIVLHIKKHHMCEKESKVTCAVCPEKGFSTKCIPTLLRHWQKDCKPWQCDKCKAKLVTKGSYDLHISVCGVEDLPYKCTKCNYQTGYLVHLRTHDIAYHSKEQGHKCPVEGCGMVFATAPRYQHHVFRVHKITEGVSAAVQEAVLNESKSRGIKIVNKSRLNQTCKKDSVPFSCQYPSCEFKDTIEKLSEHIITLHKRDKEGEHTLVCEHCGMLLSNDSDLHEHQSSKCQVHSHTEKYTCNLCNYRTDSSSSYSNHMKSKRHMVRTGDFSQYASYVHKCKLCNYAARDKAKIARHMFIHYKKGDKIPEGEAVWVHKCPLCDYVCHSHQKVKRHLIKHAKRGEQLPQEYAIVSL